MSATVFLTEDYVLVHAGLYLLVKVRVVQAHHQAVGPGLAGYTYLSDDSLVVEPVIEPPYMVDLVAVRAFRYAVLAEFCDIAVDEITVVRVVLKGVYLVCQSVAESLVEIDIGLVRIERAV